MKEQMLKKRGRRSPASREG